jgi:hypothetical protein
MPEQLGATAALSVAVVALVKGVEFLLGKMRGANGDTPPTPHKMSDRLTNLETRVAVVESRGPVNDTRFEDIIRRLERLDEKLERTLAVRHREY